MLKLLLVAPKDNTLGELISTLSAHQEVELSIADSGKSALELVSHTPYDLVVVDETLQDMSGLELADRLRNTGETLPIVLYTGNDESVPTGEARRLGIAAILRKPIDVGALFATLDPLLDSKRPA